MRVDFYHLSRDPVEVALPPLAAKSLGAGQRMLIVSGDDAQLARISEALWSKQPDSFLAHGLACGPHQERQPILLSDQVEAANGATFLALADGVWRDGAFDRIFYMFGEATLQPARACWTMLGQRDGVERRFWKQHGGKWVEGP